MSGTAVTSWGSGNTPPVPALATLPTAVEELRRNLLLVVAIFSVIALSALAFGLLMPKRYTSSTTILVEAGNIIGPLMEGRAVPTGVENRAKLAREIAFSKKVMGEVLVAGGWAQKSLSPIAQDRLIEQIKNRTDLSNPSENLIKIEYTDSDPERAYKVTQKFGELIIQESLANKERESSDAFAFIDTQVDEYHKKLTDAESKLETYRQSNPDARPGVESDVTARISELRRQVEASRMELMDMRSQESALVSQLRGESEVNAVQTKSGQIRTRMAELMNERDKLLLTYTELHPDVVRIQHQLSDLAAELKQEEQRRESRMADAPSTVEGTASFNPLYTELRSKLAEVRRQGSAMAARISNGESLLGKELSRSANIASSESTLSELTRDYEVNRDMYQDLLKRRENARVSMNLDAEERGLSFTIQEPATVPLRHSGLRLLYVCLAGLLLALLAPAVYLFAKLRMDRRVRIPADIELKAGVPLLAEIPEMPARQGHARRIRTMSIAGAMLFAVVSLYSIALAMKMATAL